MSNIDRFAILIVISLFAISAKAEPMAYSVNSDSNGGDSLYLIDLATGADQLRGKLFTGIEDRTDTEGLAFSSNPNSRLWGIDDASGTLFPINPASGSINFDEEIQLPLEFQSGGGNDFGMTFACDNSLYFTSVRSKTLYRRDQDGNFTTVGAQGSLGVNISAIAAFENPVRRYGVGNGQFEDGDTDSPNLYSIDLTTGTASLVGPLSVTDEFSYNEAGLAFDGSGGLWAITDRSQIGNQKSQILSIDVDTGAATLVATTLNEVGYESLAISPPSNCAISVGAGDGLPRIPTLNLAGRLSAILVLMLAGMLILRRRYT
ncbi:MAG: hypothetical protein QNK19_00440 [Xanthomonadales bacterium]|nr:hypothetical protein [Xanthomonadales bacterium]